MGLVSVEVVDDDRVFRREVDALAARASGEQKDEDHSIPLVYVDHLLTVRLRRLQRRR